MFGEVALDGSGAARRASPRTTRPTTTCRRCSTSRSRTRPATSPRKRQRQQRAGATFFVNDDWYTDADSNAYELPTFLGNHDMGRIGYFLSTDNPGAADAELLAPRPARARADVLLPRQPGRLLRRRAGLHRQRRRPGRPADDVRQPGPGLPGPTTSSAPTRPTAQDNFVTDAPAVPARSQTLAELTRRPPGAARRRPAGPLRLRRPRHHARSPGSTARSSVSTSWR